MNDSDATLSEKVSGMTGQETQPSEDDDEIGAENNLEDFSPFTRPSSMRLARSTSDRIHSLARVFSDMSKVPKSDFALVNPFASPNIPALDPTSPSFDAEKWAKAYLSFLRNDPETYPQRTAGVSYRDLNVYGFGSDVDYQKDVMNIFLHMFSSVKGVFKAQPRVPILTGIDGLVKPGEMCVVLGRPGSGVSTLLKTIVGETYGLSVDKDTSFNYQGISRESMQTSFRGECIYQAETDVHFPYLTVGQTLMFAALARTPANRPGITRKQYAKHLRDVIMAVFGLSHTVNSKVGNDLVRGVSGGERKRVSIAEVMMSLSALQCWDNSTRGLDSATALQFVKTLRLASNLTGSTTVVAIYQASQDAYDAFDKVSVLYEGRQIYFGATDTAKKYFTDMGFLCPPRQTTADFLTSLTNPEERVAKPGFGERVPRSPDEFASLWFRSEERKVLLDEIDAFEKEFPIGSQIEQFKVSRRAEQSSSTRSRSPYTISVSQQIGLCVKRGFQRLLGFKEFTLVTIFGNLLIGLILGSIFYQLPDSTGSFFSRGALLFIAILFNALTSVLEIIPLYDTRLVVKKHVTFALYHPASEAIASMVCELPSKVICTLALNLPLYFMADLKRDAGAFFTFLLFAFCCTLCMSMIFRTIASLTRTLSQAMAPLAVFIIFLITYTGFVLPIRSMQVWLRWLNYLNPVAYAFESLMANEFHDREVPCSQFVPSGSGYQNSTGIERSCSVGGGVPGSNEVNGDTYINATFEYYHSHLWRNLGILVAFMVFFMCAYLFLTEKIEPDRSKGEVLLFRRGHKQVKTTPKDEEAKDAYLNRSTSLEESTNGEPVHIQAQTAIFHWQDVCYEIPIQGEMKIILDHVSGWVKPGTLTALMGATGAGKTSLLNTLANRNDVGIVTGDILVNGRARPASFQRQTGYVQQQDIHLATTTVREAIQFSALLRQPASIPKQEKLNYVENVIRMLEMDAYSDSVVGEPGEGLNVEQRKRLTIGVELAAKPSLLVFLDEPTSGLDSQTAWSITTLIRKLADSGQAILCTIHQPSGILFQRFDRMLLLAKGGKTVYFGDIGQDSRHLVNYFEKNGAKPCESERNAAEWMLEVIGAAPGVKAEKDWTQVWLESPEHANVQRELENMKALSQTPLHQDASFSKQFASPFHFQLFMCLKRAWEQYWRNPTYIYSKLGLCLVTSLFLGLSFLNESLSIQGLQNQMFSFFMLLMIQVFMSYQTMPSFITQRDLYEARERPSKSYSWTAFMLANILVEIPWTCIAAIIVFLSMYYPIGMWRNAQATHAVSSRGGLMFFLVLTFLIWGATFTNLVVAGVQTSELGAIIAVLLFAMSLIFCGVLVGPAALPGFWIFMYRVSPFTYLISAFLSVGLANNSVTCSALETLIIQPPIGQTCQQYLDPYMQLAGGTLKNPSAAQSCEFCAIADTNMYLASVSSYFDERWRNLGILWGYIAFNVFGAMVLYWLARVPKKAWWGSVIRLKRRGT